MNREKLLEWLYRLLKGFICHEKLFEDIISHFAGSGFEEQFLGILTTRLNFLKQHKVMATRHQEFESLKEADGLYSMHLARKGFNMRVLYAFSPHGEPILLLAFYERSGKRKTDYSSHINPAKKRLDEVLKQYE